MQHAGSTREVLLQSEKDLKPNVSKTLVKGTIGIAVFSLFLEVGPSNFVNYLIFLGISYAVLLVYMVSKRSAVYHIDENGISVKRPLRKDINVPFDNIQALSLSQGILARRFGCGSVYIELKRGRGTHRALGGGPVLALRDVPRPAEVSNRISSMLGPFAPSS